MATPNGAAEEKRKLKILMLHGYTQSGRLFEIKTKALKKAMEKSFPAAPDSGALKGYPGGVELFYPTAPIKLDVTNIPGFDVDDDKEQPEAYGWWRRKDDGGSYVYTGMETGLAKISELLRNEGPFDGVMGFSQGGGAAGMLASLLDPGRREAFDAAQSKGGMPYPDSFVENTHPPLKFSVIYSGFGASKNPLYQAFYEPKIRTPLLHFIGSVDTVVSEERSLWLVDACVDSRGKTGGVPRVVYHPGGHFLPFSKQYAAALVAFIRESVGESIDDRAGKEEDSVEDMDVPF